MNTKAERNNQEILKRVALCLSATTVLGVLGVVEKVQAVEVVVPLSATAQSYYAGDDRAPVHVIDGAGMTPSDPVTALSVAGVSPAGAMWLSDGTTATWITFDLGAVRTVTGFHLWNYNEYAAIGSLTGRGIKTAGVYVGNSPLANGSSYASAGAAWGALVTNMTFAQASGSASYAGEDYAFAAPVTGRYIQLYVADNYGFDAYTGISEIRFYTTTPTAYVVTGSSGSGIYSVLSRDLLQTSVGSIGDALSLHAVGNDEYSHGTTASLTDGTFGDAGENQGLCIAGGTITYFLDTTVQSSGYDIAAIDTYSGWENSNRANQNYTVSFRKVGSSVFSDLIKVSYAFAGSTTPCDTHVRIDDINIRGVDAIQFNFDEPGQQNGGVAYKEIDVTRSLGAGFSPVAATAQSYWTPDERAPSHVIDGSGLTPSYWITANASSSIYPGGTMWLSDGTVQTWITFDLGAVQALTGFHLWNYNEYNDALGSYAGRGIKTAGVYAGDSLLAEGSSYASAGAAWGALVTNMTFAAANGTAADAGEEYAFATPVTTRYIQLHVTSNYGKDDYTGLSEILFYRAVADAEVTRLSSGTKVIANNATNNVRITEGTGTPGPLTLEATTTVVGSLTVATTEGVAAIDLAGQTLALGSILLPAPAGGLSIGSGSNNGTLMCAGFAGKALLVDNRSASTVTVHAAVADGVAASTLYKKGAGVLVLDGTNTYSGGTAIHGGTLELRGGSLGDGPLNIDNAAANFSDGTANGVGEVRLNELGGANATVHISGHHVSDWLNAVCLSGNATISLSDGGLLRVDRLSNSAAYGVLRLDGGTLAVGSRSPEWSAEDWISSRFSTLIGNAGVIIDTANGSAVINCSLLQEGSSTGGLTKVGSNVLTLTAPGTYVGATTVQGGTLKLALAAAIIHYDFDSANISGTTVANLGTGGASYNGVITGTPLTGAGGKSGQAVTFTGDGQGIVTANDVSLPNGFTFATWVKASGSGSANTAQRIINNNFRTGGFLGAYEDTFWSIVGGQMDGHTSQASADAMNWHHVALVWNGLNAVFYYDGAPIQTNTYAGVNAALTSKIGFGNNIEPNGEFWNGSMDEAYVFDRALSVAEVASLMDLSWVGIDVLPTTTALRLDNDATLNLDGVSQTVATLTLNDVLTRRGKCTWGAPGSGAQYTSPQFTGTGVLHVLGPASMGTMITIF